MLLYTGYIVFRCLRRNADSSTLIFWTIDFGGIGGEPSELVGDGAQILKAMALNTRG